MGFLSRLFGKDEPARLDPGDDCQGDEVLRSACDDLRRGTFHPARSLLRGFEGKWDDRIFCVDVLGEAVSTPESLDAWVAARPSESEPHLLRGRARIQAAWKERGSGWAKDVTEKQWKAFGSWIDKAKVSFDQAAALDPKDPTPWCELMVIDASARGGKELADLFEEAVSRAPESYLVHSRRLWSLLWKWHGSHEEMFAFVRKASAGAPKASLLHGLVPAAHGERWLAFLQEEGSDREPTTSNLTEGTYFADGAVRREILEAWGLSLGAGAAALGSDPSGRHSSNAAASARSMPAVAGNFAFCFSKMGDANRTEAALRLTRGYAAGFFSNLKKDAFTSLCRERGVTFAPPTPQPARAS